MTAEGKRARDDLLDALEVERYAPVPPRPEPPAPEPITVEQAARNRHLLSLVSRASRAEHW